MKRLINITRIIIGILFIFSGLVKANDPLGLSYKMQEFFEVWNFNVLNDYTLAFSILMIAFEIIAGVAVLVGWRMRLVSWLLLLLIVFFTFLTAYAVFSGKIRSCGCFGDCIPLTAQTSFLKDLVLLILILFLFANRHTISTSLSASTSVTILLLTSLFSLGLQWYVLKHLPIVDCLPYKVGKNIQQQMQIPAGAIPDSTVINFVYEKNGKKIEFTADKFPEDFDESVYHFVKRYDKLVRKGDAEPAIKDFSLNTLDGIDTTNDLLNTPGYMLLLLVKDEWKNGLFVKDLAEVYTRAKELKIPFNLVANSKPLVSGFVISYGEVNIRPDAAFLCDGVALKTAARANPTLYLLKQGTIMGKWSSVELEKAAKILDKLN